MKVIVLLSLVALGSCGVYNRQDSNSDLVDLVKRYGYSIESYEVTTNDGYILDLYRIRNVLKSNIVKDNLVENDYKNGDNMVHLRPVFLMHGLMSSSIDFVIGGPSEGLAFKLADRGYDVYLGNARGTVYGQRHTTLNPKKDAAFWRFCWHEIGTKDLPAMIDNVLSISGKQKLWFVGHMEGSTAFYVMASEKPEYNNKIQKMISLGPIAYMKKSNNYLLELISTHRRDETWTIKNLGVNIFTPSRDLLQDAENQCINMKGNTEEKICKNFYFLLNGYNSNNLNMTTMNNLWPMIPSASSIREILHLAQIKSSDKFEKFNPTGMQVEEYDLSKISVPVGMIYTPNDMLSHLDDIQLLKEKLPQVFRTVKLDQLDNNLDLLFSKNVAHLTYPHIFGMLAENSESL